MDIQGFLQAKQAFPIHQELAEFSQVENDRESFVDYFSEEKIASMSIDEYVQGKGFKEHNFCYGLERTLKMLGNIQGSSAKKFGIYFSKDENQYVFVPRFGSDYLDAFKNVRDSILDLIRAGREHDYESIVRNLLAPTIKGKILSVYYPEDYLNIFSDDHLNHYLKTFDLLDQKLLKLDPVYKRMALLDFKNNDSVMKSWPMNMFAVFLWKYFPKAPPSESVRFSKKAKSQMSIDEEIIRKGNYGFGGEGTHHKELKQFILDNPQVIGIYKYKEKSTEHILLSGDRIDVWFRLEDGTEIAVEVKSKISSDADVLRGLYQCIKYKAIMDAEDKAHEEIHDNQVVLVLGKSLSQSNRDLRDCFGITVYENVITEK